jgi:hypothetical protein
MLREPGHQQDVRCKAQIPDFERGRSDRPSSVAGYCGGCKGNTADDTLLVDQGSCSMLTATLFNDKKDLIELGAISSVG